MSAIKTDERTSRPIVFPERQLNIKKRASVGVSVYRPRLQNVPRVALAYSAALINSRILLKFFIKSVDQKRAEQNKQACKQRTHHVCKQRYTPKNV